MKKESFREIPKGKENIHYPDFSVARQLSEKFGVSTDIFDPEMIGQKGEDTVVIRGSEWVEKMKAKILAEAQENNHRLFDATYDYLAEEDPLEKADIIFVFGAKTPLRAEKAAQLYNVGLADIVFMSGGNSFYGEKDAIPEAEKYKKIAADLGVPEDKILVEIKSITIPDNVRSSLNMWDEMELRPAKIIAVNSPYSQRRGWSLFKKYLPEEVKIMRVNCGTAEKYQKEHWYKNPEGLSVVLNEFVKMRIAVELNTA